MKIDGNKIGIIIAILIVAFLKYLPSKIQILAVALIAIAMLILLIKYIIQCKSKFQIKFLSMSSLICILVFTVFYNEAYIHYKSYSNLATVIVLILIILYTKLLLDNIKEKGDYIRYKNGKIGFILITIVCSIFALMLIIKMLS